MARQLTFDLPVRTALGRDDFFISPANALALAAIEAEWPLGKMVLIGPEGSGKTHLARVWAARSGAVVLPADLSQVDLSVLPAQALVVEDADRLTGPVQEQALLHLHNLSQAVGGQLLLTARTPPARWPTSLPDLASRLQAISTAALNAPDDALLHAVLVKHFADRQLSVPPALILYLGSRMERSLAAAGALVAALDARALAEGRPVSRAMAAEWLDMVARGAPPCQSMV